MPAFTRPAPAALTDFTVRLAVTEGAPPTVDILFSTIVVDSTGAPLARPAGDLRPFLTAQQQSSFEAAALALYDKAKAELL